MWVSAGYLDQIQSNEDLEKKLTPKTQGIRIIYTAEYCNEMIIWSENFLLISIVAMGSSRFELKRYSIGYHEVLEHLGGLIVQILEFWKKTMGHEIGIDNFIDSCQFLGCFDSLWVIKVWSFYYNHKRLIDISCRRMI